MIVPFDTGDLTGFATDAGGNVDVLADFFGALRALTGNRSGMGRDFLNLKCLWVTHLMPSFLCLLDLHQKTFELRRVSVWIDRRGRKLINRIKRGLAFVLLDAAIAPVNGNADLIGLLAVDHHRLDALSDHSLGDILAASTADLDFLAATNSHLVGELRRNFDERLRHKLHVHGIVLSPVVIMLGETIRRADDIETLIWRAKLV